MKYDLNLTEEERSKILNECGVMGQQVIDMIVRQDRSKYSQCIEDEDVVAIDVMLMPISVALFDQYLKGIRRVVEEQNAEMLCKADNTAELIQQVIKTEFQLPVWENLRKQYSVFIFDKVNEENEGYVYFDTFRDACRYLIEYKHEEIAK